MNWQLASRECAYSDPPATSCDEIFLCHRAAQLGSLLFWIGGTMSPEETLSSDRIVREAECRQITGLSRTRRYQLEQRGKFPRRVQLSERATGWRLSEIRGWLASRAPVELRVAP